MVPQQSLPHNDTLVTRIHDLSSNTICQTTSYVVLPQNQLVIRKIHSNLLWHSTSHPAGLILEQLQRVELWSPNTPQSIQNFFFSLFNNFLHTLSWPSILTCSSRSTSLKFSFKISWTLLNSYLAHHPIIESHNSRLGSTDTTILPTYWSGKCTDKKCQVCIQRSKIPFFFLFLFLIRISHEHGQNTKMPKTGKQKSHLATPTISCSKPKK